MVKTDKQILITKIRRVRGNYNLYVPSNSQLAEMTIEQLNEQLLGITRAIATEKARIERKEPEPTQIFEYADENDEDMRDEDMRDEDGNWKRLCQQHQQEIINKTDGK